jgi:hypothetical protein
MAIFCWEDILEARKEKLLGEIKGKRRKTEGDDEEEKEEKM